MDIQAIIAHLKDNFGDSFDITKVTEALKGFDLKSLNITEIVSKLHADGHLPNAGGGLDSIVDGLKGKAGDILGGIFGK